MSIAGMHKKKYMMSVLRHTQAKKVSVEQAHEFMHAKAKVDTRTEDMKEFERLKKPKEAAARDLFDQITKMWESGGVPGKTIKKLANVARKFDAAKNGHFLQSFNTVALDLNSFRVLLKRVFELEFSDEEFKITANLFDRDKSGDIDGGEFLVCFKLLGSVAKQKYRNDIVTAQAALFEKEKADADLRKAKAMAKNEGKIDKKFTAGDKDSCIQKFKIAAKKYDKTAPGAMGLNGFDEKYLSPMLFREQIKLTFGLQLTPKELGAALSIYDPEHNGVVNTSDFLIQFIRSGVEQRNKALLEQLQASKQTEADRIAHHKKLIEDLEAKKELGVDWEHTPKDREELYKNLHEAAVKYDKSHPASLDLNGFSSRTMKPGAFREMLKRTFNLVVSKKDLGILILDFGNKEKGIIYSEKFLLYFIRHGNIARAKIHADQLALQRKQNQEREEMAKKLLEDQIKKLQSGVDFTKFSDKDKESAVKKMRYAALKYEKGGRSVPVDAFNCRHMDPGVFRELARRIWNFDLTNTELASMLDTYGDEHKKIDCQLFMIAFTKLSFDEKDKARAEKRRLAAEIDEKIKTEGDKRTEALEKKRSESALVNHFTAKDHDSAIAKLKAAYKNATLNAKGFDTGKITPGQLKDLLRRTFDVRLTSEELSSIVGEFLDNDKNILVKPFLIWFNNLCQELKDTTRLTHLEQSKAAMNAMAAHHAKLAVDKHAQVLKRLEFDVKKDGATLSEKLKLASFAFAIDSSKYIASLQGFKGPALTAPAFRDLFYRVFGGQRLTLPEMGVMMQLLDARLARENMISGDQFLRVFFKLSRQQELVLLREMNEREVSPITILKDASTSNENKEKIQEDFEQFYVAKSEPKTSPIKKRQSSSEGKLPSVSRNRNEDNDVAAKGGSFLKDLTNHNPWKAKFNK